MKNNNSYFLLKTEILIVFTKLQKILLEFKFYDFEYNNVIIIHFSRFIIISKL